ncbi:transcription factor EB-like [Saccostrea echinata]|uniref:transcription factor EB-like n=1 Tax=Saccostrea echinata TaxID=191078 RepID=UPI002A824DE7|nr:transcription factor EB-like [Saccostrea echinata]
MASMFQPSKTLKEIREQLKQLNQKYRKECEIIEMDDTYEKNTNNSEQHIFSGFPKKQTKEEETSLGALENKSNLDTCTMNFPTFLEEACEPYIDLSEHVESVITTMKETLEDNPQETTSQELHQTNTDMEDEEYSIDQVDHLIGDVMNSVQTDSSYDEDLHCIEQAVACTISKANQKCSLGATDESLLKDNPQTVTFLSKKEEQFWRKERIRKDNHNIIERRRRYKINDRIQELAALLPPTVHPAMKVHKGSILKASVDYIRELKKDTSRLILFESKRKAMETKYHKMMLKLFKLELGMKLLELNEEKDFQETTKKRAKRNHPEFDAMVEGMMKNTLQQPYRTPEKLTRLSLDQLTELGSKSDNKKTAPPLENISKNSIRKKLSINNNKSKISTEPSSRVLALEMKSSRRHSSLKCEDYLVNRENSNAKNQPPEFTGDMEQNEMHFTIPFQTEILSSEQEGFSKYHFSSTSELNSNQCSLLLDLFDSDNVSLFQYETQSCSPVSSVSSTVQSGEDYSSPVLSPLTQTTNMLEGLLRTCDRASSSSESHSLENSIESSGTH